MTDLVRLPETLAAWGTPDFVTTLKREIETLDTLRLALTRRMNGFGTIDEPITVMMLGRMTTVRSSKPGSPFSTR